MVELDEAIRARRAIRHFHSDRPVPRHLVVEALELAMRAPSSANAQPWHLVLASGAGRDRLVANLLAAAHTSEPEIPPCPPVFDRLHFALGAQVYGSMGIQREDKEARRNAHLSAWQFYNAPLAGIVCMRRELRKVDSIGVGAFLQSFLLALTARGVDTCPMMMTAGFPDVIHQTLDIPGHYEILCGVAIGYRVVDTPCNNLDIPRNPIEENVVFVDE